MCPKYNDAVEWTPTSLGSILPQLCSFDLTCGEVSSISNVPNDLKLTVFVEFLVFGCDIFSQVVGLYQSCFMVLREGK